MTNLLKSTFLINKKRHIYALGIVVFACAIYLVLDNIELKQSAALFIGIPYVMGLLLSILYINSNMTKHVLIGMAIGLVASFVFLKEGSFCIPMTAPFFVICAFVISASIKGIYNKGTCITLYSLPLVLLPIMSLEGTSETFSFNDIESISYSNETMLSNREILDRLASNRQFTDLPTILSWGFPKPLLVSGNGISKGSYRDIYFQGGEGAPGHAIFKIDEQTSNKISFILLSDDSHINHWIKWRTSSVTWNTDSNGKTLITWNIEYKRLLHPAWYFAPLQRYATRAAAKALLMNLILNEQ